MARQMQYQWCPAEAGNFKNLERKMNNLLLNLFVKFQNLINNEEGQDLVEYALLVTLIALAAITGVSKVATAVNSVFTSVSSSLA
jgi:pilus assembly protein Flp/PilA